MTKAPIGLWSLSIFESTLPKNYPYTLNTLRGLKRLYAEDAMNDPVKLAEVDSRLAEGGPKGDNREPLRGQHLRQGHLPYPLRCKRLAKCFIFEAMFLHYHPNLSRPMLYP